MFGETTSALSEVTSAGVAFFAEAIFRSFVCLRCLPEPVLIAGYAFFRIRGRGNFGSFFRTIVCRGCSTGARLGILLIHECLNLMGRWLVYHFQLGGAPCIHSADYVRDPGISELLENTGRH